MHAYASDSVFRSPQAYFVLAVIGAAMAWGVSLLVQALSAEPLPWWVEIPSTLTCFGIVVWIYDRLVWRWWSNLPDMTGTWIGDIQSSYDDQTPIPCVVRIRQSWLRIGIALETAQSLSHSTMASLVLDHGLETGLRYEYLSEPTPRAPKTMETHRGTAHIRLSPGGQAAVLHYYSGRGRGTTGEVRLRRVSSSELTLNDACKLVSNEN